MDSFHHDWFNESKFFLMLHFALNFSLGTAFDKVGHKKLV